MNQNKKNNQAVIAEIGTSHNGDLEKAIEMVHAAKESGAEFAKFQIIYADEIVCANSGEIPLLGKKINLYKSFKTLEVKPDFYERVAQECEKIEIQFLASVFGEKSLSQYLQIVPTPKAIKIASPELNHYPLLQSAVKSEIPLWLSTGVSTQKDIKEAILFAPTTEVIFHCVTHYPTQPSECNLRCIEKIKKKFNKTVGFSDHTVDPIAAPMVAFYYGAEYIEKHFTLSKKSKGLDDSFAVTPKELSLLSNTLYRLSLLEKAEQKYQIVDLLGEKEFFLLAGSSNKKLTSNEKKIYRTTNRSWVALKELKKGDLLTEKNCALLRCEVNRQPGLKSTPQKIDLYGERVAKSCFAGDGIKKIIKNTMQTK